MQNSIQKKSLKYKNIGEIIKMEQEDKIYQLRRDIKIMQDKLSETIGNPQEALNNGSVLKISEELDELIVKYYGTKLKLENQ